MRMFFDGCIYTPGAKLLALKFSFLEVPVSFLGVGGRLVGEDIASVFWRFCLFSWDRALTFQFSLIDEVVLLDVVTIYVILIWSS